MSNSTTRSERVGVHGNFRLLNADERRRVGVTQDGEEGDEADGAVGQPRCRQRGGHSCFVDYQTHVIFAERFRRQALVRLIEPLEVGVQGRLYVAAEQVINHQGQVAEILFQKIGIAISALGTTHRAVAADVPASVGFDCRKPERRGGKGPRKLEDHELH